MTPAGPPSPGVQTPPGQAGADESAPVELPKIGPAVDLKVVFSAGRELTFDVNDLREFGVGEGILQTPDIPVGKVVSIKIAMGSHNPITLAEPRLTLDPVIGSISAAQVAKYQADTAAQSHSTAGAIAAGAGGIVGGLAGLVVGGAVGTLAGGLIPGMSGFGAAAGARYGAQQGGLLAGRAVDFGLDFFRGDYDVAATIDQLRIHGELGLHYTPFLRLSFGVTRFHWLAELTAELLTAMNLTASADLKLNGSNVTLHFRDGKLQRSTFTLTPAGSLGLDLVTTARLRLVGSFLNILEEQAGRDESVISGSLTTDVFNLFQIGGSIGASSSFGSAKGSPMEILTRNVTAAKGGTNERFFEGLKAAGRSIPIVKDPKSLDEKSRTGRTRDDAILMDWHKLFSWYPEHLTRPSRSGRGQKIAKYPHTDYGNGLWLGVDIYPDTGTKMQYRGGGDREEGVATFKRLLKEEGIELDYDLAYKADIDHVQDWAFGGADDETNLWPLEAGANRSAGVTQNRTQRVWWADSDGGRPQNTRIEEVPIGRWFEVRRVKPPG